MSTAAPPAGRSLWEYPEIRALAVGAAALVLCLLGALLDARQFFQSYLMAFLFYLGIALGCLAVVMLQHLTGGAWALVVRRLLESATRTLPLLALLFVPLALGLYWLYVWAQPEAVADDAELLRKSSYLNVPFFLVRAVGYFAVWLGLAFLLNWWSRRQDRGDDPALPPRFRRLSAVGLALYGATVTFASIDWVMSLEPHWYSTIFPPLFAVGEVLTAFAFAILALIWLAARPPLAGVVTAHHYRDLGNLLLAFVMVWAYMAFCQFLLIWSGNLPEETVWYAAKDGDALAGRLRGGWEWVALVLVVFQFAVPFLLLLSREVKDNPRSLAAVAALVLVMRLVDLLWQTRPTFSPGLSASWMDVAALVGVGGVWLAFFLWQLGRLPLLPAHDARLAEGHPHG